jgi:subtilisin family serine protease
VPGELIVRYRQTAGPGARATLRLSLGGSARALTAEGGLQLVKLPAATSLQDALRQARARPEVLYAEPNFRIAASATPDDPGFPEQWSLHNTGQLGLPGHDIAAPLAWDLTTGDPAVVVAVLDSGIDYTHPDLAPNVYSSPTDCNANGLDDDGDGYADDCHGLNTVAGTPDPMDDNGHGTHVAGIIAAAGNNGQGITGVAWHATLLACKMLDATGQGTVASAVACLDYVAVRKDHGLDIVAVNASWGGYYESRALSEAIDALRQRGILLVTAAGNDGLDTDVASEYPCVDVSPNVLCVGASTATDADAAYSNLGRHTVHLVAPGSGILSTVPVSVDWGSPGYCVLDGTSMAAPHVTGVAALLRAYRPASDWREIKNRILTSVAPSPTPYTISGGRLDAHAALTCAGATLERRLTPRTERLRVSAGTPVRLSAVHATCGAPAGPVTVVVSPGGDVITLGDDGTGGDAVAGDGVYTATWVPAGAASYDLAFPGGDHVAVEVDADLRPGFPARVWREKAYDGLLPLGATVGDIDGDGAQEIVTGGLSTGEIYAFRRDGTLASGWPVSAASAVPLVAAWAGHPALLKSATSGAGRDVVVTFETESGFLEVFSVAYASTGTALWISPAGGPTSSARPPVAADLDGDGLDEVSFDGLVTRSDGRFWLTGAFTGAGSVAASDLFGTGHPELVYSSDGLMEIDPVAVAYVTGFPVPTTGQSPVVGDVDGDGEPEIVLVAGVGVATSEVRIYGPSGLLKGTALLVGSRPGVPALADLDGDGQAEIIVQADEPPALNVVKASGAALPGWPVLWDAGTEMGRSAPVVGDLDGDGLLEVAITTRVGGSPIEGHVRVFDRNGTSLPGFPKALPIGAGAVPAIADLDGDGRNELVVLGSAAPERIGWNDEVWVYDLAHTTGSGAPWGQYGHDAGHTGTLPVNLPQPRNYVPLNVAVTGDGTVSAPSAGISCGASCGRLLQAGTPVTLAATPLSGRAFKGWGGACAGAAPSCAITVAAATLVTAQFAPTPRTLSLTRPGSGSGTVASIPAGIDCGATCSASFDGYTRVILTATPDAGSAFVGWEGACNGAGPSCQVILDADKSIGARFEVPHTLTLSMSGAGAGRVTSSPAGVDCTGSCSVEFQGGTALTLTATPAPGSVFAGWSGACAGASATCLVTLDAARSVTARFDLTQSLAVSRSGAGGGTVASSPSGIDCGTACSALFAAGTVVTLTATPDGSSVFAGWNGACAGASATCLVTLDAARSVTAQFDRVLHRLDVSLLGDGAGSVTSAPAGIDCGATCSASFPEGTQVTLTAIPPVSDSTFAGWSGACTGAASTCVLTMGSDHSVSARFVRAAYALTVGLLGDGAGSVTSAPSGIDCSGTTNCLAMFYPGTQVTLTATPRDAGAAFAGWGGDCSGTTPTCFVTVSAAIVVTAQFDRVGPRLTVTRSGSGGGTVTSWPSGVDCGATCASSFAPGTSVSLTATPDPGSTFAGWSGACSGAAVICQVTMNADVGVTAAFQSASQGGRSGGGGCSSLPGASPDLGLLGLLVLLPLLRRRRPLQPPGDRNPRLERKMHHTQPLVVALTALALVGCGGAATSSQTRSPPRQTQVLPVPVPLDLWTPAPGVTPASGNYVYLESDLQDPVGQGLRRVYVEADAGLTLGSSGPELTVAVDGFELWKGRFRAMDGLTTLVAGYYGEVAGTFYGPGAGMAWSTFGLGCSLPGNWFAVDGISVQNGVLSAVDLRFEQRCAAGTASLRGQVHWSASPRPPPAVQPVPGGLWQPAPGSTPPTGSYAYFESPPGDPVGGGLNHLFTPFNSSFQLSLSGSSVSASFERDDLHRIVDHMSGGFTPMLGLALPEAGYYPELRGLPGLPGIFNTNPARGGLQWGSGTGCSRVTGWTAIDAIAIGPDGSLTAIDLRFEQTCHDYHDWPSLHGKIHWTALVVGPPTPPNLPVNPPPASLWQPPAGSTPDAGNYLYLQSEVGDPVGIGRTVLWQEGAARLEVSGGGNDLFVAAGVSGSDVWADFVGTNALPALQVGYYADLPIYGGHDPALGGMTVEWASFDDPTFAPRECQLLTGWLSVDRVIRVAGELVVIDLRFEQRCFGAAGALHGQLHWVKPSVAPLPGPQVPPPGLWSAPPAELPAFGSYVYLESDAGEWMGGSAGQWGLPNAFLYDRTNAIVTANAAGAGLYVGIDAAAHWAGSLQAMAGEPVLEPGYYPVLGIWTTSDSRYASLYWQTSLAGCSSRDGWFVIDQITWAVGAVASVDLRFEQHCDWSTPALRGQVHWVASDPWYSAPGAAAPPAGLWDAPAGATPAAGNYVYLEPETVRLTGSDAQLYTQADSLIQVGRSLNGQSVYVSGAFGVGTFSRPEPGYFEVGKLPGDATLSWGCLPSDQLAAWYVIDRLEYDLVGAVAALDARFEEQCTGRPALHGKIHWVQGAPPPPAPPDPVYPPPATLWDAPTGATPSVGSYVYMESSLGDPLGLGSRYLFTKANADLQVTASSITIDGDRDFRGTFAPPSGRLLQLGQYVPIGKSSMNRALPTMSWSGGARSCGEQTGWFTVDGITFSQGGSLATLDLRFEYHCEGQTPALRGKVHWDATDPTAPPGVQPVPAGLWSVPAGVAPSSGNFVYLESDPGDFMGQGSTFLYTQANAELSPSLTSPLTLAVHVDGDEHWIGGFSPTSVEATLVPGYYPDAGKPGLNPTRPALSWWGEGRACAGVSGWFAIDSMTIQGGQLTALDLRFEQRCDGGAPALRGQVHWVVGDPTRPPGPVQPAPAGLWDAPAGAVPASGSYVYLDSEPGDSVGQGVPMLYLPGDFQLFAAPLGPNLVVWIELPSGPRIAVGYFRVMSSLTQFQSGFYGELLDCDGNPARGCLLWDNGPRFPNTATGWFVIDRLIWNNGVLASLDLRFEQHAHSIGAPLPYLQGPALHGKIHYEAQ